MTLHASRAFAALVTATLAAMPLAAGVNAGGGDGATVVSVTGAARTAAGQSLEPYSRLDDDTAIELDEGAELTGYRAGQPFHLRGPARGTAGVLLAPGPAADGPAGASAPAGGHTSSSLSASIAALVRWLAPPDRAARTTVAGARGDGAKDAAPLIRVRVFPPPGGFAPGLTPAAPDGRPEGAIAPVRMELAGSPPAIWVREPPPASLRPLSAPLRAELATALAEADLTCPDRWSAACRLLRAELFARAGCHAQAENEIALAAKPAADPRLTDPPLPWRYLALAVEAHWRAGPADVGGALPASRTPDAAAAPDGPASWRPLSSGLELDGSSSVRIAVRRSRRGEVTVLARREGGYEVIVPAGDFDRACPDGTLVLDLDGRPGNERLVVVLAMVTPEALRGGVAPAAAVEELLAASHVTPPGEPDGTRVGQGYGSAAVSVDFRQR